ncbi:MAG: hypothetical protein KDA88_04115 [Planctomycetaceae bacterium]|nr:hypothetical protein [Planctomycetaceae bacterium]MCB9953381.1 hypothetical protein [Planctomycetaceae bacterium]
MAISVNCEECGQEYSVPDDKGGRKFRCKTCGEVISVPDSGVSASSADAGFAPDDDDYGDDDYRPRRRRRSSNRERRRYRRSSPEDRVKPVAICLIIVSILSLLLNLLRSLVVLIAMAGGMGNNRPPGDELVIAGMIAGAFIFCGIGACQVYGSFQMLNLRSLGLVRATVIVSLIPFCSQLGCVGIPFAIWALIVLGDSEVQEAFES